MDEPVRKIKIISDGLGIHTKVVDAETGEDLRLPITKITWEVSFESKIAIAKLKLELTGIDAEAEVNSILKRYLNVLK